MADGPLEMRLVVATEGFPAALLLYRDALGQRAVGRRAAGHLRLAFGVADARAATEALVQAGAPLIAAPVETPWRSLNSRLLVPAGFQLTLFGAPGPEVAA